MQAGSILRRSSRAVRAPAVTLFSRFLSPESLLIAGDASSVSSSESRFLSTSSLQNHAFSASSTRQCVRQSPPCSMALSATFCSAPDQTAPDQTAPDHTVSAASEDVKEIYDKMLHQIIEVQCAPPNPWMWSMIEKCKIKEDIVLLFDILQKYRVFRLYKLRIYNNYNNVLCQQVTKACLRAGAIDYGIRSFRKNNVFGLSPSVVSANHLLTYCSKTKNSQRMCVIMKHLKRNHLPLLPSTADIVFRICKRTGQWKFICKYAERFQNAGVRLHKTAFGYWLEFAANRGYVEALWKIEKLRSDLYNEHNLESGFACAKGFLLDRKPEAAASMIQALYQADPDSRREPVLARIQKLVAKWPLVLLKYHWRLDYRKELTNGLKQDIPTMLNLLANQGLDAGVNLEDLNQMEALQC